ncbi:transcription antiterminator [Serpentinimonas raichei]|uniref:Transcription antitermination protein RfaH n=1 Tax=Serpentinimonas raichei TaxID=1458425 RepID=A0A060NIM1_9BURK|nr:transcription/translation regulatory transformer protein RfaH [Serpentinimonas raichei]BAO81941.1 transcription antiterminator [Serpentinimonas raichei]
MHWYLVHTKPRKELCALEHLERQGFDCYLPLLRSEKLRRAGLQACDEPLFPRYLFIQLGLDLQARSWGPIRSTVGVSRLVAFGSEPAKVPDALVDQLRLHEAQLRGHVVPLFQPGQRVCITQGPFAGLEGVFQIAEGERRVLVLIEMLCKPVLLPLEPSALRKAG